MTVKHVELGTLQDRTEPRWGAQNKRVGSPSPGVRTLPINEVERVLVIAIGPLWHERSPSCYLRSRVLWNKFGASGNTESLVASLLTRGVPAIGASLVCRRLGVDWLFCLSVCVSSFPLRPPLWGLVLLIAYLVLALSLHTGQPRLLEGRKVSPVYCKLPSSFCLFGSSSHILPSLSHIPQLPGGLVLSPRKGSSIHSILRDIWFFNNVSISGWSCELLLGWANLWAMHFDLLSLDWLQPSDVTVSFLGGLHHWVTPISS